MAALFTLVLTVVLPQSAQAWSFTGIVKVKQAATYCVGDQAGIDHLTPGLFSGNLAYGDAYAFEADCVTPKVMQARSRLDVRFWSEAQNAWITCRSTGWTYGTTGHDMWGPTGPASLLSYGGPVCGVGWYATRAYAEVWVPNILIVGGGFWSGGSTTSAYEWVETSG
ncbi:hypothetical protein CTZ28_34710 [Streptomyces shenzhenensis]|uniref:Uncharacterized protein n=1 Tax=Streptomyces shenzhenensis TaxID=943815 RepID=A0A3M0I3N4_9ACTN|nr:hypothetical protein CTZ28_34710 [Streptomyces shenzhenensis]